MAGSGAILGDAAEGAFSPVTQRRIWSLARLLSARDGVEQAVPGVNNILITFDSLHVPAERIEALVRASWEQAHPDAVPARECEIPVQYGGEHGEDLQRVADHAGLSVREVSDRHQAARYAVAAVGAMPGFVYLTGLDPALAIPRRDSPRLTVARGAVIIGGGQAGIMPCTAPSGWHILGHTDVELFSLDRSDPLLLHPGDTVRFRAIGA